MSQRLADDEIAKMTAIRDHLTELAAKEKLL
jgi:hypothetical protein